MATVMRYPAGVALLGLLACGKPTGLGGPVTVLAQVHVLVPDTPVAGGAADGGELDGGELDGGSDRNFDAGAVDGGAISLPLRAALVWGMQWWPEPFCLLPPESAAAAQVIAAGCPDSFGFTPARVGADTPITPGVPATLDIIDLPTADLMVGDLTARIAYASIVVYGDGNGNGALDLASPPRQQRRGGPGGGGPGGGGSGGDGTGGDAVATTDVVVGASFISMTLPDQRVAYREGDFNPAVAFYPRVGCPDPPPKFSVLSAGGFSREQALAAALGGGLPAEDPATCGTASLDQTIVVPLQPTADLRQLACVPNDSGGVTYYREAPPTVPNRRGPWACMSFPHLPGDTTAAVPGQQLVWASAPNEPCRYTFHYTLRGCNDDPGCATRKWDLPAPPPWWPCAATP
jgi:hypothetical protein